MLPRKYCFAPAHRRELHDLPNVRLGDDLHRLALECRKLRGWRPNEKYSLHALQRCSQRLGLVVVYGDDFDSGRWDSRLACGLKSRPHLDLGLSDLLENLFANVAASTCD